VDDGLDALLVGLLGGQPGGRVGQRQLGERATEAAERPTIAMIASTSSWIIANAMKNSSVSRFSPYPWEVCCMEKAIWPVLKVSCRCPNQASWNAIAAPSPCQLWVIGSA